MEENIIGLIAQAEDEATAKKAQATEEAAMIISAAEKKAQEIAKSCEAECAALREATLKNAEEKSALDYDKAIAESHASAKAYADSRLQHAENIVSDIVGRLTK